jgi:hypothetical protein
MFTEIFISNKVISHSTFALQFHKTIFGVHTITLYVYLSMTYFYMPSSYSLPWEPEISPSVFVLHLGWEPRFTPIKTTFKLKVLYILKGVFVDRKTNDFELLSMSEALRNIKFIVNAVLLRQCCFQIFELHHIFKGLISYLYINIFP